MTVLRKVALGSAIISVLGISAANAHVEFSPDTAIANKSQVITLNVPHDCTSATKTMEVKFLLPAGLKASLIKPIGVFQHGAQLAKWSLKVTTTGTRSFLDANGPAITTGPDGGKNSADIRFKATPNGAPGTQLKLPAVQYCTKGAVVNWVQPRPADGSDPAESATPVPVLNLK
jgi:uncharacterized protein YcnI